MEASGGSGLTLPSFRKPPVTEVVLAFNFTPLPGLQFAALADLRSRWAKDLPEAVEQPFLESPSPTQGFRIEVGPPPRRIWLVNADGDQVVQVQRDRLIANWRSVSNVASVYPRYDSLRDRFLARWEDFQRFVAEQQVAPAIQAHSAEVTYINVIGGDTDDSKVTIADVLKMNREGELWRDDVQTTSVTQSWSLPDAQTTLTTIANIDVSTEGCPVVLQIVASTQIDESREPAAALDLAHEFVVGTFGVITTDEMQHRWERE